MEINKQYLTPNPYSRPGKKLGKVKGIVIHWVANPGSKAEGNRNFFENRKHGKTNYGSAHFIVDGKKVIQCLPLDEQGYHVGSKVYTSSCLRNLGSYPNNCTIGIEMCHPDSTGKPTAETYQTTMELVEYLMKYFKLNSQNLWTHQQVVGWKPCHKYYVDNPKEWVKLVADAAKKLDGKAVTIPTPKPTPISDMNLVEVLDIGDRGEKVKELQTMLNKLGYNCGNPDGVFGDMTDKAVEKYQKDNGLLVDGAVGEKTLAKIKDSINKLVTKTVVQSPPKTVSSTVKSPKVTAMQLKYTGVLKEGSKGHAVKDLQNALVKLGAKIKIDSDYGKATKNAVADFQKKNNLKNDGIAGHLTYSALNKQLAK